MKITMERAELAEAMAIVAPAVAGRGTASATGFVRLESTGGHLVITASGPDMTITTRALVGKSTDGVVHTSGLYLRDLASKFTADAVTLALDDTSLVVTSGGSKYRLKTLPAAEYPPIPKRPDPIGTTTAEHLRAASAWVAHAVTDDPDAKVTFGVLLEAIEGDLHVVGTDRFRMGVSAVDWAGDDFQARLLHGTFRVAVRALRGEVTVYRNERLIAFGDTRTTFTCQLIDGEPFPWSRLIDQFPTVAEHTIDVADFTGALSRLLIASERDIPIRVDLTPDGATLTSHYGDAHEETECTGEGTAGFWVAPNYLHELLSSLVTDSAVLQTGSTETKPFFVHGGSDGPKRSLQMLMPRRKPGV